MLQDGARGHRRPPARRRLRALALAGLLAAASAVAPARADDVCEAAAAMAADAHGVPLDVMRAVLRVETGEGRGEARRGWPWSANADGRSYRFADLGAALAFAAGPVARAAGNVDLGCFQISRRWHGDAFEGAREMLDPARNALYAARLLAGHHARTGDWTAAAGAYHSRTEAHAGPYRARVRAELAALGPAPEVVPAAPVPEAGTRLASALPTPFAPIPIRAPARSRGGVFTRAAGLAPEAEVHAASFAPEPPLAPEEPLAAEPPLESADPLTPRAPLVAQPLRGAARPLLGARGAGASLLAARTPGAGPGPHAAFGLGGAGAPAAGGAAPGSLMPASAGATPLFGAGGWGG